MTQRLRIGARGSRLSLAQCRDGLARITALLPDLRFSIKTYATAGDLDRRRDLALDFPDDFFTDTLDRAVLAGEIDAALHSAKDLPQELQPSLRAFWLPWREDARDAVVTPIPARPFPKRPRIGVSSANRRAYARKRWPSAEVIPIRGNVDERLVQLDAGKFDAILLAAAGLKRLGLGARIAACVPPDEIQTHPAQGALAVTYRRGHEAVETLRRLLTHPVVIAGAGTGRDGNYSLATLRALEHCTLCLHDALLDSEILSHCAGRLEYAGRRGGEGGAGERERHVAARIIEAADQGERVVRLKGGDPSLFGRLAGEIAALTAAGVDCRVLPGIPWLCSAPAAHGIFLTERRRVRHFHVATGTGEEGEIFDPRDFSRRGAAPIYFFMAAEKIGELARRLMAAGYPRATPAAVLRGTPGSENIVRGHLGDIKARLARSTLKPPALVLVGEAARAERAYKTGDGPLAGMRVLVPGTPGTRTTLTAKLEDLGARPYPIEVFRLLPSADRSWLRFFKTLGRRDWVVLSSESAAKFFLQALEEDNGDVRRLPKLAVSGPAVAAVLRRRGLRPDLMPEDYTSRALGKAMAALKWEGRRVMIPRSEASQSGLPRQLRALGAEVNACVLYHNRALDVPTLPPFDAALFCSPSALEALLPRHAAILRRARILGAIGPVTARALQRRKFKVQIQPAIHDADHLVYALASHVCYGRRGRG